MLTDNMCTLNPGSSFEDWDRFDSNWKEKRNVICCGGFVGWTLEQKPKWQKDGDVCCYTISHAMYVCIHTSTCTCVYADRISSFEQRQ